MLERVTGPWRGTQACASVRRLLFTTYRRQAIGGSRGGRRIRHPGNQWLRLRGNY